MWNGIAHSLEMSAPAVCAHLLIARILLQSRVTTPNSALCANKTRPIDYTINPFSPPRCDCGARLNGKGPIQAGTHYWISLRLYKVFLSICMYECVCECVFECARPVRARLHSNGRKDELKQASRRKIVVVHERGSSGCWQMCCMRWVISSSRPLHSSLRAGIYLMPKPPPL